MIYVIDTSSLMVFKNYYPGAFPSFWQQVNALVAQGQLISVREVREELGRRTADDHVSQWCGQNGQLFKGPTESELRKVADIFAERHFQQLIGRKELLNGFPVADPFVIARAWDIGGCVITEERLKPNAAQIPNICVHFQVECVTVEGMIEREGWTF